MRAGRQEWRGEHVQKNRGAAKKEHEPGVLLPELPTIELEDDFPEGYLSTLDIQVKVLDTGRATYKYF